LIVATTMELTEHCCWMDVTGSVCQRIN